MNIKINTIWFIFLLFLLIGVASAADTDNETLQQTTEQPDGEINQATIEAVALLTDEELGWLKENLPDLIAMIDTAMADYPEIGPIKNERSTSTIGWSSETELADEDWTRVRTALETAKK